MVAMDYCAIAKTLLSDPNLRSMWTAAYSSVGQVSSLERSTHAMEVVVGFALQTTLVGTEATAVRSLMEAIMREGSHEAIAATRKIIDSSLEEAMGLV